MKIKVEDANGVEIVTIKSWTKHQWETVNRTKFSKLGERGIGYDDLNWLLWKQWSDEGRIAPMKLEAFAPTIDLDFYAEDDSTNPMSAAPSDTALPS